MQAETLIPYARSSLLRNQLFTSVKVRVAGEHAAVLLQGAQSQLIRGDDVALHVWVGFPRVLRVAIQRLACASRCNITGCPCNILNHPKRQSYHCQIEPSSRRAPPRSTACVVRQLTFA